jgi:hypothetical protein
VINVSVFLTSTKRISVYKYDNTKKDWFFLFTRDVPSLNNQIVEEIQLGDSNRYKIRASNYGGYIPIPMFQEQEFLLNTSENVSLDLNPNNGQYDLVFGFIIIGICLIVIGYEIRWIRQWIQKRKESGK